MRHYYHSLILIRFHSLPDTSLDFAFSWHGMGCLEYPSYGWCFAIGYILVDCPVWFQCYLWCFHLELLNSGSWHGNQSCHNVLNFEVIFVAILRSSIPRQSHGVHLSSTFPCPAKSVGKSNVTDVIWAVLKANSRNRGSAGATELKGSCQAAVHSINGPDLSGPTRSCL